MKGAVSRSEDPAAADAANAPVLTEYGFQRLEKAAYTRDDGRNLTIKAAVFADASGAYGAFTYYYSDEMGQETIGGQAAFLNNRVLFYQGNVLVDAVFDRMSVMSASQMRQLAGLLPQAEGNKGTRLRCPRDFPRGPTRISRRIRRSTFWVRSRWIGWDRRCRLRWWISSRARKWSWASMRRTRATLR